MDRLTQINKLYFKWANEEAITTSQLPLSGSNRIYYRVCSKNKKAIAVFNEDYKENLAFIKFSEHFKNAKLNVPEIYQEDLTNNIYLQEDLGNTTLYSFLTETKDNHFFKDEITTIYKKSLSQLIKFQLEGKNNFDFSVSYPRDKFDKESMLWDLNYFKYYFLKLAKINFDEQALQNDFETIIKSLSSTDTNYFMYRDFQSRNIMLINSEPYFVDYQGGRKGALQYDLASVLFDAKADLSVEFRNELFNFYINELKNYIKVDEAEFKKYFYGYVLIRILQAFGAYGYRGFFERKEHFLLSIPYAINNISWLINEKEFDLNIPEVRSCIDQIIKSSYLKEISDIKNPLRIVVQSFSYKRGIPVDETGNGGGFVFDCRALNNPGRFEEYSRLTGNDTKVIEFLEKETDVTTYLNSIKSIIDISVSKYLERNFNNLQINFGCTGGQHRSVYCANSIAKYIKDKYENIEIVLRHREQELKNKI